MKQTPLLVALLLGACSPEFEVPAGASVSCGEHGECPAGTSCIGGLRCLAPEAVDEAGTRQLTPEVDAVRFTGTDIEFAWSPLNNVGNYTLYISTDEAMTQLVADTPKQTGARSEERVQLGEGIYWWRATADVSVKEDVAPRRLLVFGDAVYVFCAASDSCEPSENEVGTVDAPYTSIVRGLVAAARIGVPNVRVATRDATTAYEEALVLSGGINILGGYSRDFASRDGRTLLRTNDTHVRAFANTAPITVDHFELTRNTGAKPLIAVEGNSAPVTISNCSLSGHAGAPTLISVAEGAAETVITDTHLNHSAMGGSSVVISSENAHLRLERTTLTAAGAGAGMSLTGIKARGGTLELIDGAIALSAADSISTLHGVVTTDATLTMRGSTVRAVTASRSSESFVDGVTAAHGAIRIEQTAFVLDGGQESAMTLTGGAAGDSAVIRANRIDLNELGFSARGIQVDGTPPALTIVGNTFVILASAHLMPAIYAPTATPIVVNNLVICSASGLGMHIGSPMAVYANAFVGSFAALYSISGDDNPNPMIGTTQASENQLLDNTAVAGIPQTGYVPHPENLAATSPLVGAGHDPDATDCGGQLCGGAINDIADRPRPTRPTIGANEPL